MGMISLYESIIKSNSAGIQQSIDEWLKDGCVSSKSEDNKRMIDLLEKSVAIYKPKDNDFFRQAVELYVGVCGDNCSLNWIDTSEVTDMHELFARISYLQKDLHEFNGDISKWDVSKVTNMSRMFYGSKFNGDISKWDVSNVVSMKEMFDGSYFNQNIKGWKINSKCDTTNMWKMSDQSDYYKPPRTRIRGKRYPLRTGYRYY